MQYLKHTYALSIVLLCTLPLIGQCDRASLNIKKSLITNGDFSMGDVGFKTLYRKEILPYEIYGAYSIASSNNQEAHSNKQNADGNYFLADVSKRSSDFIWKQKVKVKPDRQYYFSIDVANMSAHLTQASRAELLVTFNGDAFAFRIDAPLNHDSWMTGETMYLSGEEKEITIEIYGLKTMREGNDVGIDNMLFIECGKIQNKKQNKDRSRSAIASNRVSSQAKNSNTSIGLTDQQNQDRGNSKTNEENSIDQNVKEAKEDVFTNEAKMISFKERTTKFSDTLSIVKKEIDIFLWDDNVMDGDIISLYLNGEMVLEKHALKKERFQFALLLSEGENILSLFAENMGMIPPNTVSMIIKDDLKSYRLRLESDFKTNDSLILDYGKEP